MVLVVDSSSEAKPVSDVTEPGHPFARTKTMRVTEELGAAPLIWNPLLNRGTNFSEAERAAKSIEGLLPPVVESLDLQAERVMYQLRSMTTTALSKYNILMQIASTNTTLFYKVLIENLTELAPIVYTPTVGEACQKFDLIYRAPLGMYFSAFKHRGKFTKLLDNWVSHAIQIIVVTDGGRILGLGDLGTNGIGISIGKVSLYVGGAGFHPEHSLPVVLDVGTNNKHLLEDKFYLGEKVPRLHGEEHLEVVEELCMAVKEHWPNCLVQFEDFQTDTAFAILERLRHRCLCFNDDIQGTGAVVCAGFINGMKAQGITSKDARVVFYGAGSSAVGVAHMVASYMVSFGGLTKEEAYKRIYAVDTKGLITTSRGDKLAPHKVSIARTDDTPNLKTLHEVIKYVHPTALIGLSGAGPSFFEADVAELCAEFHKPLIFPLSNPTDKAEITAENAITWSQGKCIFASGSPFSPVTFGGKTVVPGQANNVLIFPGVGFGAVMVKAKEVADEMLLAAAQAVADFVSVEDIEMGLIYPGVGLLRDVSLAVATAVGDKAFDLGLAGIPKPDNLKEYIKSKMYYPE